MCKQISKLFLVFIFIVGSAKSLSLPDYIPACSRNDPNLNACALEAAKAAIAKFARGDPDRGWQALDPMFVKELVVYIGPKQDGLKLVFKDNVFTGLSDMKLTNIVFDLENKTILSECTVNLNVKAQYDLSGRILILPITGNGDASIKLKNTTMHIRYWYEHVTGADGKIHWKIVKNDLKYEVGRAIFRLENLLGADKRIGDQINRLLNELWREIVADVGPTISGALSGPVVTNVQSLLDQVPYDEFMPEK